MPTLCQKSSSLPSTRALGVVGEIVGLLDVGSSASASSIIDVVGLGLVDLLDFLGFGCGFGQFGLGLLRRGLVDVGNGDDLVDRVDDVVPAAADHRLDLGPALAAGPAGERVDAAADASRAPGCR